MTDWLTDWQADRQPLILLIKFAKLFGIKPLSWSTNNVQHATGHSRSSSSSKYSNQFEKCSAYRHLCSLTIHLSFFLYAHMQQLRLLFMLSMLPQHGASVFALRRIIICGCCSTCPHACKLVSLSLSLSLCVCVYVQVIFKIASQVSCLNPDLPLPPPPHAASSVRFTWQKLCAVSTFDYCRGSYYSFSRLDICTFKNT